MKLPLNRYILYSVYISADTYPNVFYTPFNLKFRIILKNQEVKDIKTEYDLNYL